MATTTTRYGLRIPTSGDRWALGQQQIANLGDDVDARLTPHTSGLLASRPTSTVGTPGIEGRTYRATDTGDVYLDTGTSWLRIYEEIEALREIGAVGQPAFTSPATWSSSVSQPAAFYRHGGRVYMQGLASRASSSVFTDSLFTLPSGYRPVNVPSGVLWFRGQTSFGQTGVITIQANGVVTVSESGGSPSDRIYLNQINFRCV